MKAALVSICLTFTFIQTLYSQSVVVNKERIKVLVNEWNDAHNDKNISKFKSLYSNSLVFYCKKLSRDECLEIKAALFRKYKRFDQRIISTDLLLTAFEDGTIKVDFTKEVSFNNKTKQYPSYLLLGRDDEQYTITGESDKITDRNLHYRLTLGSQTTIVNEEAPDSNLKILPTVTFKTVAISILIGAVFTFAFVKRKHWKNTIRKPFTNRKTYYYKTTANVKTNTRPMSVVNSGNNFQTESVQNENSEKGYKFEQYVSQKFNRDLFKLLDWRSDKGVNGLYPESNLYPDLKFRFKTSIVEKYFEVECKYRVKLFNNAFHMKAGQMDRYKKYQQEKDIDVYLLLGLGGSADAPREIYLIPLSKLELSDSIDYKVLAQYRKSISSNFFMDSTTLLLS